jgi:hypothetical protein
MTVQTDIKYINFFKYEIFFFFLFTISVIAQKSQKIGTNQNSINPSALLELESTTKGLLLPRMTLQERDNILSPPAGLMVYYSNNINYTAGVLSFYDGINWLDYIVSTVPSPPVNVQAIPLAIAGQASVSFTIPTSNGGFPITSYIVTASPGGQSATGTVAPVIMTGLTNGTAYTFTVVATNAAGSSIASTASASVTIQ